MATILRFFDRFKLKNEKENFQKIAENIERGIVFRGTNLWILAFAILIASLGLNINSTAVVIGAMLISPLMGPIVGLGFGMAINDIALLKKSLTNYLFAAGIGLTTSTLYFLISPLSDAHSEILARVSPNIYDVLIALFGGFAGMLAISSKQKGNVVPGVAIATALMPPLCTAGFGLASFQFEFFFGALYLFIINTVFIAVATLLTARFLDFPLKRLPDATNEIKAKRIVWGIVWIIFIPSVYFGYDIVKQSDFQRKADQFITNECIIPNNYILQKTIDAKKGTITLIYGGQKIEDTPINAIKQKLPRYNLQNVTLEVQQGFAYLQENKAPTEDSRMLQLTTLLNAKESAIQSLTDQSNERDAQNKLGGQVYDELKVQHPDIQSFILQKAIDHTADSQESIWVAIIHSQTAFKEEIRVTIEQFLKVRLTTESIKVYFEEDSSPAEDETKNAPR